MQLKQLQNSKNLSQQKAKRNSDPTVDPPHGIDIHAVIIVDAVLKRKKYDRRQIGYKSQRCGSSCVFLIYFFSRFHLRSEVLTF